MIQYPGFMGAFCSENCTGAIQTLRTSLGRSCTDGPVFLTAEAAAEVTTPLPVANSTTNNSTATSNLNSVLQIFGGLTYEDLISTIQGVNSFACAKTDSDLDYCFNAIINNTMSSTRTSLDRIETLNMNAIAANQQLSCNYCFSEFNKFLTDSGPIVPSFMRFMQGPYDTWTNGTSNRCPAGSLLLNQTARDEGIKIAAERAKAAKSSDAAGTMTAFSSMGWVALLGGVLAAFL
jgi:hypothetical protein